MVIILTDGLRPDAVAPPTMPSLYSLSHDYTRLANARTIQPSTTVAALASLATGVAPATHQLTQPGLGFLKHLSGLRPVAHELERRGITTTVVAGRIAAPARSVVRALTSAAGVARVILQGSRASETAEAALEAAQEKSELQVVYLHDCDRAGHAEGWMSAAYLDAASEVDAAVAKLAGAARRDLLVVLSDHGGGGLDLRDHPNPTPSTSIFLSPWQVPPFGDVS